MYDVPSAARGYAAYDALMTRWEYQFIEVHQSQYNDLKRVMAVIQQAGRDGWEAVGQVTFSCTGMTLPVVMLKRPAQ
jgi:hypothetical protein